MELLLVPVLFGVLALMSVRLVPRDRARTVERLGRYHRTLQAGVHLVIPVVDRVRPPIDLREQVLSFRARPVTAGDGSVVGINAVLHVQVVHPYLAASAVPSYLQAVERLTVTSLHELVGSMDRETVLSYRDSMTGRLRKVIAGSAGAWGLQVNRVEIDFIASAPAVPKRGAVEPGVPTQGTDLPGG